MSIVLGVRLHVCPLIARFGIPDASLPLNSLQKDILAFTSVLARRILLHWKSEKRTSISQWLRDMILFLRLDKIRNTLRGCTDFTYSNH